MSLHKSRITRNEDFQRIFREGIRVGGQYVVIHADFAYKETESQTSAPRLGFVVSKRIGNAVNRNLVKRRLQGITREITDVLLSDGQYVFRAKPDAKKAGYADLKREITRQVVKANERMKP